MIVPEWCRYRFFYDAAVFLYSSIERNDTRNFREKKIFRVALSGTLEVNLDSMPRCMSALENIDGLTLCNQPNNESINEQTS